MAHSLFLGMTMSGKTTLAKQVCNKYRQSGIETIVLDPLNDPEWNASYRTYDPEKFLEVLWSSRRCAFFIDEAGEMVGRFNDVMNSTATKSRHWGHKGHFISQRGSQLSRTVRDQCSNLFLFRSGLIDRKLHREEWSCDDLINPLDLGECYYVGRNGIAQKINVFT